MDWNSLAQRYHIELHESVIPFWEKHSVDKEFGGFITCLLRDGTWFDTDKFVWLQARQVWTFAKLYERFTDNTKWLDVAEHGAEFLIKHGRDDQGNWYFSLKREGTPLVQPYNIFSDCFACMAFGQLYKVTQKNIYRKICLQTYDQIVKRKDNAKGPYEKRIGSTRPLQNFALPMILANLTFELKDILDHNLEKVLRECADTVMKTFYEPELDLILENVNPDGTFNDSMDGRLVNPGHAIEAMSFMMDIGEYLGDEELISDASLRTLRMLKFGWDESHGGIYYFMDALGYPTQQLEWDQKLWWVHLESLVASIKGYALTNDKELMSWFQKIHDYCWSLFTDPDYGEWYGYLNRRGEILLPLKGGKWKGCFHVPRSLWKIEDLLRLL